MKLSHNDFYVVFFGKKYKSSYLDDFLGFIFSQSMDLLTGVTPPISANLVSSFRKRRQSSACSSFTSSSSKQSLLINKDETQNSVVTSIKSFIDSHLKLSVPDQDLSVPQENRKSTLSQSVFNGNHLG